ncbi:MAG: DegV family protein [Ardenticatenaceae bacterium]|nr:DegV family protein [Ardenticatenaceae bacterium]HBY98429.1 DegV family protein [Chloroflexota bacterium]
MTRPVIVTDSTADLTPEEIREYGIIVVPLNIHFGSRVYQDGVDLDREEFFELLEESPSRPATSSPSVATFQETYEDACDQTDQVISIHISAKLSDTIRRARQAADTMLGQCRIMVIDSQSTSVGLGLLVKAAARAAAAGQSTDEIVRMLRGMISHIYLVFFVETLDFLERGGRIGKAQALLGTMLNIKPMLILEEGEIEPLEKVRTRGRALDKLTEFVAEFGAIDSLTIIHNQSPPEELEELISQIRQARPNEPDLDIRVAHYGPVLAAHVGPDALGIVVYEGLRENPWDW